MEDMDDIPVSQPLYQKDPRLACDESGALLRQSYRQRRNSAQFPQSLLKWGGVIRQNICVPLERTDA